MFAYALFVFILIFFLTVVAWRLMIRSWERSFLASLGHTDGEFAPEGPPPAADAAPTEAKPDFWSAMRIAMADYGAQGDAAREAAEHAIEEAPIVRVANTIIQRALKERASAIHLETGARGMRVRYRVDGALREHIQIPKYIYAPLIARFKQMAEMDIMERRAPQEGHIGVRFEGNDYDIRAFTLPSQHGEQFVLRIYDRRMPQALEALGFPSETRRQLESLLQRPNGLILFSGPAGSGKTTTLYAN